MTSEEERRIKIWNSKLSRDVHIHVLLTDDERGQKLKAFCENLTKLAPRIRVAQEEGEPNEPPAIQVGRTLRYHGIPLGTELEPFLEALSDSHERGANLPEPIQNRLKELRLPAMLRLFVSQQCPFCPTTVRQITPLLSMNEFVHLTIVDCTLFPEVAQSNRIQSVPTLLLEEEFRWTGSLRLEEVLEVMTNRDPAKLGSLSLERMLREGNAAKVAEMMLDSGEIFPAFLDLLVHRKWPVRLGAMVVMEEIANRDPQLAAQVIDPRWERFDHVEDSVKGDIVYVLGESGGHKVVPRVQRILAGEYHPDVKEAAKETIEKINSGRI